ncbi:MAG: FKBP-type peptidyl-prolyl cis-trans isomerase [Balneolaceae bacterium]|nr:FKBP-type peptidyl-prolyl cis-trans isomerase [Balneolaceae bacterium]
MKINKNITSTIYTALFLILLLTGCLDSSESEFERQVREADEMILNYLETNNIEAEKQQSGIYIEKLHENQDGKQVVEGHIVGILYTMTHLEGDYEVEAHEDSLNPLRFSNSLQGNYHSIYPAGLNYEIGKMREGEKYRFFIPSYQAFESYSHKDFFDAYSHFIIETELVEVKTEDEIYEEERASILNYIEEHQLEAASYPNSLFHIVLEEGDGDHPSSSSQVTLHFSRKYLDGTVIEQTTDDEPLSANLNGSQLVRGFEDGVLLMREGEKAKLIMPSKLAFGKSIQVIPQALREIWAADEELMPFMPATKPFSPVIYEVELLSIQ